VGTKRRRRRRRRCVVLLLWMSEFAFVGFELCSGFLRTAAVGDGAGMVGGIAAAVAQRRRQARRNTARDWRRTPAVGRRNLTAALFENDV